MYANNIGQNLRFYSAAGSKKQSCKIKTLNFDFTKFLQFQNKNVIAEKNSKLYNVVVVKKRR